jgi:hypothetical protein
VVLTTGTTDVTGLSFFEAEGAADTDDAGGTEFAEVATLATLAATGVELPLISVQTGYTPQSKQLQTKKLHCKWLSWTTDR